MTHATDQATILVTGAARSGKSEWAEHLAIAAARPVIYIATAQANPDDADWQARIARHRQRRSPTWQTREAPIDLAAALRQVPPATCVLVDSLGTWLANRLAESPAAWAATVQELLDSLAACPATVILVAEETGWGVVPAYPLGRQFRDRLGQLTRQLGPYCDAVYLVVAGYALNLQTLGDRVPEIPSPD